MIRNKRDKKVQKILKALKHSTICQTRSSAREMSLPHRLPRTELCADRCRWTWSKPIVRMHTCTNTFTKWTSNIHTGEQCAWDQNPFIPVVGKKRIRGGEGWFTVETTYAWSSGKGKQCLNKMTKYHGRNDTMRKDITGGGEEKLQKPPDFSYILTMSFPLRHCQGCKGNKWSAHRRLLPSLY